MEILEGAMHQKYHATEGGYIIQSFQDVSSYLRANERMYAENQTNRNAASWRKDHAMGWHKASIPEVIVHQWLKEFQKQRGLAIPPKITDPEFKVFMYKKLRDPHWRKLRVDGRTD